MPAYTTSSLIKRSLLFSLLALLPALSMAQASEPVFGQNRVQYHEFEWSFYESENFNTYFYIGGQDLGKYVIQAAETYVKDVIDKLDFQLRQPIDIMVYTDITDRNMSNIGIYRDPENTGGTTDVVANKVFVYFNGDHADLERQLKEGIARVYIDHMLFGVNFQEVLQNAVLLNLPGWFADGLVRHIGEPWSPELDNQLREALLAGKYEKLNVLSEEEAAFVGHAFWHYVEEVYGESAVPNLLYLTRINRSLESGFLFVLGSTTGEALQKFRQYYLNQYSKELAGRTELPVQDKVEFKHKKNRDYYNLQLNPQGTSIAYAENHLGKFKVHIRNLETGDDEVILKQGFKTQQLAWDHSFPLMDWDPKGKTLAVLYEKRDQIYLLLYDSKTGEKTVNEVNLFQKVFGMSFMNNDKNLVLSAMQKGQCDIFTYYIPSTKVTQITNDYWDDLNPSYVEANGRRGIMFMSNRLTDTLKTEKIDTLLPSDNYNLFFYNQSKSGKLLTRVTDNALATETYPQNFSDDYYVFLSNESGITNRYAGYFKEVFWHYNKVYYYTDTASGWTDSITLHEDKYIDSVLDMEGIVINKVETREVYKDIGVTFPLTDYETGLIEQDVSFSAGKVANLVLDGVEPQFYVMDMDTGLSATDAVLPTPTLYMNKLQQQQLSLPPPVNEEGKENKEEKDKLNVNVEYYFQSQFNKPSGNLQLDSTNSTNLVKAAAEAKNADDDIYQYTKTRPYFVKLQADKVVTQLNNSLVMSQYQKYTPNTPVFTNPPLGAMFKLGVTDILEDYKIYGGFRFPLNFQDSEYFITYENLRKRWDKKFTFYRKAENFSLTPGEVVPFTKIEIPQETEQLNYVVKTNQLETQFSYALDVLQRFEFGLSFRNDNYVYKASDNFSLPLNNYAENWVYASAAHVYDNTINLGLNLRSGTRWRVFAEFHKQIPTRQDTIFGGLEVPLPQLNNTYFTVVGFDLRHYLPLHNKTIWANRLAFGTSMGTSKLLYYLGGVDGWIGQQFDDTNPVNEENDYAYQALATNMRGHPQNVRNGNSYFVLNSEVRVPIFSYILAQPVRSEIINNFQVVGFFDLGTAWEGLNPFNTDDPLSGDVYGEPPVVIKIDSYRSPVVAGYGFGLRTVLFGYFIRGDVAWGYDGEKTPKPIWHFSLNLDF